jgi:hypothetical protein
MKEENTIQLSSANLEEISGQVLAFDENGIVYAKIANYKIDTSVRPPTVTENGIIKVELNDTGLGSMIDGLKKQKRSHSDAIVEIDASLATLAEIRVKYDAL